jgi:hypothetical protein
LVEPSLASVTTLIANRDKQRLLYKGSACYLLQLLASTQKPKALGLEIVLAILHFPKVTSLRASTSNSHDAMS